MKGGKLNLVLCGMLASALMGLSLAQDDEIRWFDSYGEAVREAKRTGKPIFLEFRCEP